MDAFVEADPFFKLADATEDAQAFALLDDSILKVRRAYTVRWHHQMGRHKKFVTYKIIACGGASPVSAQSYGLDYAAMSRIHFKLGLLPDSCGAINLDGL